MKIVAKVGNEDIAMVYIAELNSGNGKDPKGPGKKLIEFVESVQPPTPRSEKWVLIVSTLFGCPVGCSFCDAGMYYDGKLTKDEILSQIDFLIHNRFPRGGVPVKKFKIQFARMGEPALNENVLDVLEELPDIYDAPGLMPSISTIAPKGTDNFFERLLDIKKQIYGSQFQLQFSIHSTDVEKRKSIIPVKIWDFKKIASFGERFYNADNRDNERKITLNFALAKDTTIDPDIMIDNFSPEKFIIKVTPVNPTCSAKKNHISSHIVPGVEKYEILEALKNKGYDVILSIGELAENDIGSNCGQHIMNYMRKNEIVPGGYTYPLINVDEVTLIKDA